MSDEQIFAILYERLFAIASLESFINQEYVSWLENEGREKEAYAERNLPLSTTELFHTLRDAKLQKMHSPSDLTDAICTLWQGIDFFDNCFSHLNWKVQHIVVGWPSEEEIPDNIQAMLENGYVNAIAKDPWWALARRPVIAPKEDAKLDGTPDNFATDTYWTEFDLESVDRFIKNDLGFFKPE